MDNEKENKDMGFDSSENEDFLNNLFDALGLDDEETEEIASETDFSADANVIPEEDNSVLMDIFQEGSSDTDTSMEMPSFSEDELFAGVDAALAEQIEQEFGSGLEPGASKDRSESGKQPDNFKSMIKEIPTWTKVVVSVIFALLISIGLLFGTAGGRNLIYRAIVEIIFHNITVEPDDPTPTPGITDIVTPEPTLSGSVTPEASETPKPTEEPAGPTSEPTAIATPVPTVPVPTSAIKDDEDVINILLLGEENIHGAKQGRTDAIILVSMNKNGGNLKMISFLRDTYVQIPGHADGRLNSAHTYGGASLMVQTIENNFKIDIDGYAVVNFSGFEDIIDYLGGLELSLTAKESEYLNTTEYISDPAKRNTVPGKQVLCGSQVLGFCRVRYVPAANGQRDDYGRAYRHRTVLKALFEQNKNKNIIELLSIMNKCFEYVTASQGLKEVAADCMQAVIEKKMFEIESMQIPKSGHFSEVTIGGQQVTRFDLDNIDIIQEFLYGE